MIIDITKSYLRNLQEGDTIYSIGDNIQYKIMCIVPRYEKIALYFDEDNSYEDLAYATLDEGDYKIFREITID